MIRVCSMERLNVNLLNRMLHIDYIINSIFNSRTYDKPSGIKLALIPEVRTDGAAIAEAKLALHIGHTNLFRNARTFGDYLIVAVQEDESVEKFKPGCHLSEDYETRARKILECGLVDEVVPRTEGVSSTEERVCIEK